MLRAISGGIIAVAVVFTAGLAVGNLSAPCPTEDSSWCTWYADIEGNSQGQSFTAITDSFIINH